MMKYFPVNLDVTGKPCLVVGGGRVGLRKVRTLLRCDAQVTVVSPDFDKGFEPLKGIVQLLDKAYESHDLAGQFLVFAATDSPTVNQQVKSDARDRNILCNIADDPDGSQFVLPAIVQRGDLVVTVSTSGKSPALAKRVKHDLEAYFGPEYGAFLLLMGEIRKRLLAAGHDPDHHRVVFHTLINKGLLQMVAQKDEEAIDDLIHEVAGLDERFGAFVSGQSEVQD